MVGKTFVARVRNNKSSVIKKATAKKMFFTYDVSELFIYSINCDGVQVQQEAERKDMTDECDSKDCSMILKDLFTLQIYNLCFFILPNFKPNLNEKSWKMKILKEKESCENTDLASLNGSERLWVRKIRT